MLEAPGTGVEKKIRNTWGQRWQYRKNTWNEQIKAAKPNKQKGEVGHTIESRREQSIGPFVIK